MIPQRRRQSLSRESLEVAIRDAFKLAPGDLLLDFGEVSVDFAVVRESISLAETIHREHQDKTLHLSVQTNGTRLTEEVLDFLADHQVTVGISLDGPKEFHDQARRTPDNRGSHAHVEAALKRVFQRKMNHIVLCTINSSNVHRADMVLDYFLNMGITQFSFKPVIRRGHADKQWSQLGVTPTEYCEFIKAITDYALSRNEWNALDDRLVRHVFRLLNDYRGWTDGCATSDCGCGSNMLVLSPTGAFFPCPRFTDLDTTTEHLGFSVADALDVGTKTFAGINPLMNSACVVCPWFRSCKGGCPISRKHLLESDQNTAKDPDCVIYRYVYESIVSRILPALSRLDGQPIPKLGRVEIFNSSIC